MINHKNGKTGEDIAAEFFEANGYTVLHRNYRSGHLETDLIVENFESVAFVEVRPVPTARPRSNTALRALQ